MTPDHPRWNEFLNRLEGIEGCNFERDSDGKWIWNCDATTDRPLATTILKRMSVDIDIEETLAFFDEHSGFCDCEIVLNVVDNYAQRE